MLKHVKHSGRWLISHKDWTAHLTFAVGGIAVGLAAVFMAVSSEWASHLFRSMTTHSPYLPFIVSPLGLILVVG